MGEAGGGGRFLRECPEARREEESRVELSCGNAAHAPSTTSRAILYVRCAASPGTSPLSGQSPEQWRGWPRQSLQRLRHLHQKVSPVPSAPWSTRPRPRSAKLVTAPFHFLLSRAPGFAGGLDRKSSRRNLSRNLRISVQCWKISLHWEPQSEGLDYLSSSPSITDQSYICISHIKILYYTSTWIGTNGANSDYMELNCYWKKNCIDQIFILLSVSN